MTNPTNTAEAQFTKAYDDLIGTNGALAQLDKYQTDFQTAGTNYAAALSQLAARTKNPMILLYALLSLLLGSGANTDNSATSVLSDKMGVRGAQLKCEIDINKCNSALLAMTNDTTDKGAAGTAVVTQFAKDAQKMVDLCQNNKDLSAALGSGATSALLENFQNLRNMVFTNGAVPGDPTIPQGATPQSVGCYFDTSGTRPASDNCLTSFHEMHKNAAMQQDLTDASQAITAISTNTGANASLLSGVQAQVNTLLSALSNSLSTIESFASDLAHAAVSISSLAVQNMRG